MSTEVEFGAARRRASDPPEPVPAHRTGLVVRERLLRQLLVPRYESVVLIDGPTGSGKSTLARQWQQRDERVHVQISVSRAMDEPAVLAGEVVTALEAVKPLARKTRSVVTASEPTFSATLLPALQSLAASRSRPYVLVVDDVHLLRDADCHRVLTAVADGVPPGSTLAVLTRERSPSWLATTRAGGRLHEIDREGLAFDVAEASELFADLGLDVPEASVVRAVETSHGWPVGLYLGGLALRRRDRDDPTSGIPVLGGPDRSTRDYLRSQVLDRLDQDTRDFLVRTAIIEDLTPALCDAVLERRDSLAKLRWLEDNIQLVVDVDPAQHRFRLHHLLADTVHAELQAAEPDLLPALHRRAAAWYQHNGDLDAAIRHAQESGDIELVGQLVWSGVPLCAGSGWPDRLRQWLAPMSDADVRADRWLTLSAAWSCLQSGDATRMRRWQLTAEEHAGPDWRERAVHDEYAASLATLAALVGRDGMQSVRQLSDAALQGLPAASPHRTVAAFLRSITLTLDGDLDEGARGFQETRELGRSLGVAIIEADALSWLGLVHLLRRQTAVGLAYLREVAVVMKDHDLETLATSAHSLGAHALGEALSHQPGASATLARARRMTVLTEGIAPWFAVAGRLVQAWAAVALGDRPLARQLVTEARMHTTPDVESTLLTGLLEDVEGQLRLIAEEGISAAALTAAELRVLHFLPSHLNYPQIGEQLFVSPNTVKTHALSIYRKFGVSSRADAVRRGRELGLLDEPPHE